MAVFYLISVLSILIVFIVPYIIGTRYMIKKTNSMAHSDSLVIIDCID